LGFPYVIAENLYGIFLPAGVPKAIREKLYAGFAAAAGAPSVKEQLAKMGLVAAVLAEGEVDSIIARQASSLAPVARDLKIRIE
jgi:tripartite-type tricarboxylate transporter receptor subunit TctC